MNAELRWRYQSMVTLFGLACMIIFARTVWLQLSPVSPQLRDLNDVYEGAWVEVYPPRGQIYDRYGHLLAGNQTYYEIGLDYRTIQDPEAIAFALNGVLEMNYTEILALASIDYSPDNQYLTLSRLISAEKVAILKEYMRQQEEAAANGEENLPSLKGVVFRPYLHRSYPEKELASNILGFVSVDGQGYFGVEQYYQKMLAGESRTIWLANDPNQVAELPDIPPASDLVLTIDRQIQAKMEILLDDAIEKYKAAGGTIIIMDPKTGEIMAMASTPRMNLNEYWRYDELFPNDDDPFNRAVGKSFEPGSVFKVITLAAALDSGTVEPTTTFLDTGQFEIGGITIKNWDGAAWGEQDMTGCMRHSLNVCLAWMGDEMGAETFYEYMNAFGFGHFTGVDLAGEATGRLKEPGDGDWYPADLGTNTFGQGIAITATQLMMSISAIANEGAMVVPQIVHAHSDGTTQYYTHPQVAGNPITPETAKILTEMLAVSLESEASDALVDGYRMAGKTGTAEIPTPDGYTRSITNASFIGWGPADDPQFIVYVWLEEPTPIWGSLTAAPVFADVVRELVVLLNLPPDHIRLSLESQ